MNLFKINFDNSRIYGLDILRAFAILFVVYDHGITQISNFIPKNIYTIFVFDGVSIFFVLSGFLIGGILIKTVEQKNITITTLLRFWMRRWLRTIPNYILILIILIIIKVSLHHEFNVFDTKKYFFFLQNFNSPHPDFFPEAWSLSIEEWFYMLFPMALFSFIYLLKQKNKNAVIIIAITFIVISTWLRYNLYIRLNPIDITYFDKFFRKQIITRLDSITFGVIGAYLFYYYKNAWLHYKKTSFFLGVILLISPKIMQLLSIQNLFYSYVFSFTIASLGALLLLPYLNGLQSGKGFFFIFFTYVSVISYSLYLVHLTLIQGTLNLMNLPQGIFKYSIYIFASFSCSILLYRYFELPIMKIREKF